MQPPRVSPWLAARRERAGIGSAALHAFFLFRACTKRGLFSLERIPFFVSRSGESMMLSQKRPRLPYGTDFPQTLLTCRRPVFPPDRAPLCLWRLRFPQIAG
jgi:hypothetical protein